MAHHEHHSNQHEHHEDHHSAEHSHHGHHGHHKAKHYSDQERELWGLPRSTWNKCTDEFLDFRTCTTKNAGNFFPFSFIYTAHWADRWICKDEHHLYQECYLTIVSDFQASNKEEIAARR
jgi:hypothetical protein